MGAVESVQQGSQSAYCSTVAPGARGDDQVTRPHDRTPVPVQAVDQRTILADPHGRKLPDSGIRVGSDREVGAVDVIM